MTIRWSDPAADGLSGGIVSDRGLFGGGVRTIIVVFSLSVSQSQIPRDFRLCVCVCFKKRGFERNVKRATFQKGACEATMADSATFFFFGGFDGCGEAMVWWYGVWFFFPVGLVIVVVDLWLWWWFDFLFCLWVWLSGGGGGGGGGLFFLDGGIYYFIVGGILFYCRGYIILLRW